MQIDNEYRFRESLREPINLFLGAGFSVLASSADGPLPVGGMLSNELREAFKIDSSKALRLDQISTVLMRTRSQDLEAFLRARYAVTSFDERYGVLKRLSVASLFTTNIDNLLTKIYHDSETHYLNDVFAHGASSGTRAAIELVQLHGCVDDPSRPLTFSTLDIAAARTNDPDQWTLFRQRLQSRPTIYWGYSMSDSGTLEAVRSQRAGAPAEGDAWIQIRPGEDQDASVEYFRALGLQVIVADTSDLLDYISTYADETTPEPTSASARLENVPPPGSTAARPLEEFYLGHPPTWSDIYARGVAQTSYFRTLQDRVAARKSTVVAGIPGCGKTTLLMQLAAFTSFAGPKMIFDGLSGVRAELLARQIGDDAALIILDNVASDIEAFEVLSKLKNCVVIAADRDYNLGNVSSRLTDAGASFLAVSDLHAYDLQYLWDAIPARIRRRYRVDPEISPGRSASAFEFILANVERTPLGDKLIESIHEMHDEGSLHADLLLAACYMEYCRTRVTVDVLVAYFRGLISDFSDIYRMSDQLGGLLSDGFNGEQDTFTARSMLVAEHVLRRVRPSVLRAFLNRFHQEVSPLRISKYDTFRRRGYNWRIFSRAFASPLEGVELYDQINSRDESPEILQQKALFLADKRRYEEAFFELDRARASRRRMTWSIENSYFNVLFKANIERAASDDLSKQQCLHALNGLANCYDKDRRKGFHALVFGECAKHFASVTDEAADSRRYLERANDMLGDVAISEPWLYRPPILKRQIERALRGLPIQESDELSMFDEGL